MFYKPQKDLDDESYRMFTGKLELDKVLHSLEGIMKGIAIDSHVNPQEALELIDWYKRHQYMIDVHPMSEIIPVISRALEDNQIDQEEAQDIIWLCNQFKTDNLYFNTVTSDLQRLQGMIHGIMADNMISRQELTGLREWMEQNEHLANVYPYTEISSIICSVLADGAVSSSENNYLKAFFSNFIKQEDTWHIDWETILATKKEMSVGGVCAVCPEIIFPNNVFCFTGKSSKSSREEFASLVNSRGGKYKNNVVESTNYLVVGNEGSSCWTFSCYGRKVEKAVNMRKAGNPVLLVHENDFWDSI